MKYAGCEISVSSVVLVSSILAHCEIHVDMLEIQQNSKQNSTRKLTPLHSILAMGKNSLKVAPRSEP